MNGKGIIYAKIDEEIKIQYEGYWKNNRKHGQGKEFNFEDDSVYEGTFGAGKKCGYGTQKWANGSSYSGYWSTDMMSGSGKLLVKKGDETLYQYEGNFVKNKKDGYGVLDYGKGKIYKG